MLYAEERLYIRIVGEKYGLSSVGLDSLAVVRLWCLGDRLFVSVTCEFNLLLLSDGLGRDNLRKTL